MRTALSCSASNTRPMPFTDRPVVNNSTVANTTPPVLAGAEVKAQGDVIRLTFNEDLDIAQFEVPPASAVTVKADGAVVTVQAVLPSFGFDKLTLELSTGAIKEGQTVTVSYAVPGTGNVIEDTDGGVLYWEVERDTVDDAVAEANGTFTVQLQPDDGYTLGTASSVTVKILDDDDGEPPGPVVTEAHLASGPGPDGAWRAGDTVEAVVRFSEAVTVDTSGGTPALAIVLGGERRQAVYAGGSGTAALVFRYAVGAADDGARSARVVAGGLSLNGATIRKRPALAVGHKEVTELHHALSAHPVTANRAVEFLSRIYNAAEDRGQIPEGSNPCRLVVKYRERRRERFLTDEEFRRLGRGCCQLN